MASKADYTQRQFEQTHDRIETNMGTHYWVPKKSEAERSLERVEKARQADESFFDWYFGITEKAGRLTATEDRMRVEAENRARARVEPSPKALAKRRERTEAKARAEAEAAERRRHPQPYELGPVGFQVGDIVKLDLRSEWAMQGRLVDFGETYIVLDELWTYDNGGRIANEDNRLWPGTQAIRRDMVRSAVKLPENEPRPWGV